MNNRMKCFLIVFLGMLAAMAPLSTDMYLPALPEFSEDFHISTSLAQLTLTMTLIGMAVGQILGGSGERLPGEKKTASAWDGCFYSGICIVFYHLIDSYVPWSSPYTGNCRSVWYCNQPGDC